VADEGEVAMRLARVLVAVGVVAVSVFASLVGMLWGFGLKCDDTCSTPPPWRNDAGAWQWNALGAVGPVALGFALALLVGVASGRKLLAFASWAIWVLVSIAYISLFKSSGLTSPAYRGWLGLAIVGLIALLAVASLPGGSRQQAP
jgi:hypothetical protein